MRITEEGVIDIPNFDYDNAMIRNYYNQELRAQTTKKLLTSLPPFIHISDKKRFGHHEVKLSYDIAVMEATELIAFMNKLARVDADLAFELEALINKRP